MIMLKHVDELKKCLIDISDKTCARHLNNDKTMVSHYQTAAEMNNEKTLHEFALLCPEQFK